MTDLKKGRSVTVFHRSSVEVRLSLSHLTRITTAVGTVYDMMSPSCVSIQKYTIQVNKSGRPCSLTSAGLETHSVCYKM